MENKSENKEVFKYNMSLYYQSAIIYFLVFVLYVAVRGQLSGGYFKLVFDSIIYFFILILIVAFVSIFYNLYLNKKLIIDDKTISFEDRSRTRNYEIDDIVFMRITKERQYFNNSAFKLVRIKFKRRRGLLIIRPCDYENEKELASKLLSLKEKIENKNV
jgi:hypothetical protein